MSEEKAWYMYIVSEIKLCFHILFQNHTNLFLKTLSDSWFCELLLINFPFEFSINCEMKWG